MRCNRRIVTNGAYRRFRRFVRWFKNSGAGARCVTNNKRKWADRIHFVQFNSEYGEKENIIKMERKI